MSGVAFMAAGIFQFLLVELGLPFPRTSMELTTVRSSLCPESTAQKKHGQISFQFLLIVLLCTTLLIDIRI
jgi:hypothetical protein